MCLFYARSLLDSNQSSIHSTFWFIGLRIKQSNDPVDLDLTEIIQDFSNKGISPKIMKNNFNSSLYF